LCSCYQNKFCVFSTKGRRHSLDYLATKEACWHTACTDHDKELVATFENGETVKAVIWRRSIPAQLRLSIQTWQSNMVKAFQEIEQYCHEWELLHLSVITLITYSCIAGKYIILNVHNSFCIVFVSAKQIYICYRKRAVTVC
jgi:hypothetical protein